MTGIIPAPYSSLKSIPEEYKKMSLHDSNHSTNSSTVKKCIPFLDALTAGYIIPFPVDINCYYKENSMNFELGYLPDNYMHHFKVTSHIESQISKPLRHNKRTVEAVFKFMNPWHIKTPPGYSCIFTQPFNRNLPFKIIDGIVDTDDYPFTINLPFYWTTDSSERVLLEKNSPMVLVIPFKRESWKMTVDNRSEKSSVKTSFKWGTKFENVYKNLVWKKKKYR